MKTTAKDEVRALLEKLPDDASLNDIQYHIYVRQKIERGLEAIQKGNIIPAVITVYEDRSFTFITKLPPVSAIIKKTLGLKIASQKPGRETAGSLTMDQARDIAAQKLADLNTDSLDSALKTVMGTARSMGIKVI